MPSSLSTLTVNEYGTPSAIVRPLAELLKVSLAEAEAILRRTGERLQRLHSLPENPIEISREGVVAKGIAGVVSLGPRVDLEIRPKFAGPTAMWRADLMYLALYTSYGRIDPIAGISSGFSEANNLSDIVARIIVQAIEQNHRSPLRVRRQRSMESFEPDGEIDPDVLLNPGENGWRQTFYAMSRDNEYWATIYAGAMALRHHIRDVEIAAKLVATVTRWGRPTTEPSRFRRVLPPRIAAWQTAYDIAFEIIRGSSLDPQPGRQETFEFTLDMWRTWETLIARALVSAFGADRVRLQGEVAIGIVMRDGKSSTLNVRPDGVVLSTPPIVVDAKYKGRWDRGRTGISAADRYEAMAFMSATGFAQAVLLYPSTVGATVSDPIDIIQQEHLPTGQLAAVGVGLSGVSGRHGLRQFTERLNEAVDCLVSTTSH